MVIESVFETVPLSEIENRGLVAESGYHRPVVLVVDDEAIIADTRAAIFEGWGYAALTAYSGEAALEIARVIPPELLVTDVIMTGMTGIDLAMAVRKLVPDCEVVLFSGLPSSVEMLAAAHNAGYNFTLLDKPLHPAQLYAHLSQLKTAMPARAASQDCGANS